MEFPQVIARIAPGLRLVQQRRAGFAVAARLDRTQIGKKIGGAAQPIERAAAPILRQGIDAIFDVPPILFDQMPQIAQQLLAVGRLAAAQSVRHRQRLSQTRGEQFLAEKPADPR